MTALLKSVLSRVGSAVELRLFSEYGAVFATTATPPPRLVFSDAVEVEAFQSGLVKKRARVGDYSVELQAEAMESLLAAEAETGFGARADDSGGRSYDDTVRLWTRNVTRGLEHWLSAGRISPERAEQVLKLSAVKQIEIILKLEDEEQLWFGTFFDRSILYSVAAPGASQHLSLLAFDVAPYDDELVEQTLNRHGWFRTVPNDLPHFTYIGYNRDRLPELGLKLTERVYGERQYGFWVPDIDTLS
jgi:hypothetical protein